MSKLPCCGPCAQKQKRLRELGAAIRRLMKNAEKHPRAKASMEKYLAEQRSVTSWLAAHHCVPPMMPGGRATRISIPGRSTPESEE
ncbi:MAG: hypothetical protein LAQ69_38370 [Acidobacteriia bacterium]|nr:hypothetical protein [Terriglobia bacterium]